MEPRTVALLIDGILAFAAIVAGCLQLKYGLQVFRAGHGAVGVRTKLNLGKWSIDTGSTGVAVMALASLRALAAIELRQNRRIWSHGRWPRTTVSIFPSWVGDSLIQGPCELHAWQRRRLAVLDTRSR
jgi:hypothetical protein